MNGPNNDRYRRRFPDPKDWPSNAPYGLYAEIRTQERVNELSWQMAAEQVADEATALLKAEVARQERRRAVTAEGFEQGWPGE